MSRRLAPVVLVPLALVAAAIGASPASAQPLTSHPRIWIRQSDLPRLRSWAVSSNPLYQDGIRVVATTLKTKMDDGSLLANDHGTTYGYTQYPIEWAAQVFAFTSLVENDATVRADYAARSRTLLMYMMNKAVLGPIAGDGDFRGRVFSTDMRSLFYGDAFPTNGRLDLPASHGPGQGDDPRRLPALDQREPHRDDDWPRSSGAGVGAQLHVAAERHQAREDVGERLPQRAHEPDRAHGAGARCR